MRTLLALALAAASVLVFFAADPAFADNAASAAAIAATPLTVDLKKLVLHAGLISGAIFALVRFLKSPLGGIVAAPLWGRLPPQARVLLLASLCAAAGVFEAIALGKEPVEAVSVALIGLLGAVGAREVGVSLTRQGKPKTKAAR